MKFGGWLGPHLNSFSFNFQDLRSTSSRSTEFKCQKCWHIWAESAVLQLFRNSSVVIIVTGSHFSTNRAAGRHAEQQHRRDSCRRERLRLPSYTAGQTPTVHRYRKQVTAGRHVITACQSDITSFSSPPGSFSSPPGRYCLPTWRDSPHRLQILIALPLHR